MKTSYKVALIAAILLCVCALVYPLLPGRPSPEPSAPSAVESPHPGLVGPAGPGLETAAALGGPVRTTPVASAGGHKPTTPALSPNEPAPPRESAFKPEPVTRKAQEGTPPDKGAPQPPGERLAGNAVSKPPPRKVEIPPAPTVKVPTVQPKDRPYTIRQGDTFISIARAVYGSSRHAVAVSQANPRVGPLRLRPGQVIRLPAVAAPPAAASEKLAKLPDGSVYYVVRAKDTLSRIASSHYKNSRLWPVIYRANRLRIGADPDRIQPGSRLVIPPNPAAESGSE